MVFQLSVYVDPAAALRRGETQFGQLAVEIDDEFVKGLPEEYREVLAELVKKELAGRSVRLSVESTSMDSIRAALEPMVLERSAAEAKRAEEARTKERILRDPGSALARHDEHEPGDRWRLDDYYSDEEIRAAVNSAAYERNMAEWTARGEELRAAGPDAWAEQRASGTWYVSGDIGRHLQAKPYRGALSESPVYDLACAEVSRRNEAREAEQKAAEERLLAEHRECERRLLAEHGTQSQRERWEAGVLPEQELRETAHRVLFAPLDAFERSTKPTMRCDCRCGRFTFDANEWTGPYSEAEWNSVRRLTEAAARVPGGTFLVRRKRWECNQCHEGKARLVGRVETQWAGRDLAREYRIPVKELTCDERNRPSRKGG